MIVYKTYAPLICSQTIPKTVTLICERVESTDIMVG